MHKQSKKQDFELAALMFLLGLLLFFYPVVTQVSSYQADEEAYEDLAMEYMPPEISPGPVLPIPKRTETPTEETPQENQDESSAVVLDFPETEPEVCESPEVTEEQTVSPVPADDSELTEAPDATDLPVLPTGATAAPTAAVITEPTKKPTTPTAAPTQPGTDIDLNACLAQNRDFVAWLTIPGTKINYPVVRSDNTEYYLHHLFTGKESKLGCLFSLKSSDYQTPSKNIAIYGHHISHSDAMFSTLMDYKDASYCSAHSLIRVSSLYGDRTYNNAVITYGNDQKLPANTLMATGATDAKGNLTFSGMFPHGDYYVKEISVPQGWLLSAEKYPVKLTSANKAASENVITVYLEDPILNHLIYTPVTITKTDITGAEKLPGALIEVYDADGNTIYREYTNSKGEIPNIPVVPGTYTFKETYAPSGYALNVAIKTFTVTADGKVTGDTVIRDELNKVELKKVKDNGEPLPGAVFGLFDAKDTKIQEATSKADGSVLFTKIP